MFGREPAHDNFNFLVFYFSKCEQDFVIFVCLKTVLSFNSILHTSGKPIMSYRRNLFNGRYALRFESQKLDFLPLLPEELQIMILSQLRYLDLRQCMLVSKAWNKMVNSDHIWMRVCLDHGLELDEDQKFAYKPESPLCLCKWAKIWWQYRSSPAFGWRWRVWKDTRFYSGNSFSKLTSDGKSVVRCLTSSFWLMKCTELQRHRKFQTLPVCIDSECSVAVDNDYIAITKCNIVIVYKWMEKRYKFILALSTLNNAKTTVRYLLKRFLNTELCEQIPTITILAFCKGCIWLQEHRYEVTFVLNLSTSKIARTLNFTKYYTQRHLTKWYIVSWSSEKLRVDTFLGNNILKIKKKVIDAIGNENILIVFSNKTEIQQWLETYDLCSGKRLVRFSRPFYVTFALHSSKNILYGKVHRRNKITAIDVMTGDTLWTCSLEYIFSDWDWRFKVVCDKYLVLLRKNALSELGSPIATMLVYNALTGEKMYHVCAPVGWCLTLSDHLIISKDEDKKVVNIRSFLTRPY